MIDSLLSNEQEQALRMKRDKKEAMKNEELQRETDTRRLTQIAAAERKKEVSQKEGMQKDTMKKLAAAAAKVHQVGKATTRTPTGTTAIRATKKNSIKKRSAEREVTQEIMAPVAKPKKAPVAQGLRKVPKATDEHGCRHSGVRDLVVLHKNYLAKYVKVGGWLHRMPCKGCEDGISGVGERERVKDVSSLLTLKGNNAVGYICNCGPTGHAMEEENSLKEEYSCDMVLCMGCYTDRTRKADNGGGNKRTRRNRNI